MKDLEGGRHSYDDIPLELFDNVGLPDPVASVVVQVERRIVGTRRWTSELYSGIKINIYEAPVLPVNEGVKS